MNRYLIGLIKKYAEKSVTEIIDELDEKLPYGIGTAYVGDLLAIYEVICKANLKLGFLWQLCHFHSLENNFVYSSSDPILKPALLDLLGIFRVSSRLFDYHPIVHD